MKAADYRECRLARPLVNCHRLPARHWLFCLPKRPMWPGDKCLDDRAVGLHGSLVARSRGWPCPEVAGSSGLSSGLVPGVTDSRCFRSWQSPVLAEAGTTWRDSWACIQPGGWAATGGGRAGAAPLVSTGKGRSQDDFKPGTPQASSDSWPGWPPAGSPPAQNCPVTLSGAPVEVWAQEQTAECPPAC